MRVRTIAVTLGALILPVSAFAQTFNKGFALDRFDPANRGSDWFGIESLSFSNSRSPALGLTLDYAHQPLVLRTSKGEQVHDIVGDQLFLHLGAAFTVADDLNLGINLPIALVNDGNDPIVVNGASYALNRGATLGDLRLGAQYRLFGGERDAVRGAFGVNLHLPTGSRSGMTGDNGVRFTPVLQLAGDAGVLAYAGSAGWKIHSRHGNYAGRAFGSDLELRAAVGIWAVPNALLLGPELYASTPVSDGGDGFFKKHTTAVELMLGAHVALSDEWRAGLGAGPGIGRGMGSPEVRLLASLEWAPAGKPAEPTDRDHDGVQDAQDACPDQAGSPNADPKLNGCPVLDRDQDGIKDAEDACPDQAGPANADPKLNGCPDRDGDGVLDNEDACPDEPGSPNSDRRLNGCRPSDRDGDGIDDRIDACPDQRGEASSDRAKNGCPVAEADDDGDGIPNSADACPDKAGPKSSDPTKNGCPLAKVEAGQIAILEQVQFVTGSAEILAASDDLLEAVKKILVDHPEITKVAIEGHTDNRGGKDLNRGLSRQRAVAVQNWLVKHGIAGERLSAAGYGQDRPLADNDTDAGRQKNRRVEFHIVEVKGKKVSAEPAKK
jgi:outer membrane protein OmpA-like peptidoglycan-associated protein